MIITSTKYLCLTLNALLICLVSIQYSAVYSQQDIVDLPFGPEVLEQMVSAEQSQLTERLSFNSEEIPQSLTKYCKTVWFYVKNYPLLQERLYQNQLPSISHYELAEFECSAVDSYNYIFETAEKNTPDEFSTEYYVSKLPSTSGYEIFYFSSGVSEEKDCAGNGPMFFGDCESMTFGLCAVYGQLILNHRKTNSALILPVYTAAAIDEGKIWTMLFYIDKDFNIFLFDCGIYEDHISYSIRSRVSLLESGALSISSFQGYATGKFENNFRKDIVNGVLYSDSVPELKAQFLNDSIKDHPVVELASDEYLQRVSSLIPQTDSTQEFHFQRVNLNGAGTINYWVCFMNTFLESAPGYFDTQYYDVAEITENTKYTAFYVRMARENDLYGYLLLFDKSRGNAQVINLSYSVDSENQTAKRQFQILSESEIRVEQVIESDGVVKHQKVTHVIDLKNEQIQISAFN